jgi:hypothetical protein
MHFPQWSDLGSVSSVSSLAWESEIALREKYARYYDGLVFSEHIPDEAGEDAPLMYPVGINLVKMLCLAQTDSLFGEWEDQIISFEARKDVAVDDPIRQAIELSAEILRSSNGDTMLWEVALDMNIYGGGVVKVTPNLSKPGHIQWYHVPIQNFFPVWDPDDADILLEVYVVTPMTSEQAQGAYGVSSSGEIIYRVEHWTRSSYENKVDGTRIEAYSGVNPWGFVPFVFIPRLRSTNWWGDALTEDIISVQDELNARVADIGEALNYNAHPVRWGRNLPRSFNARHFPLGPNALWDLGRQIGSTPPPEVGLLEAKAATGEGAHKHVSFLYDWARTSSFAPPISFGEDEGSQRSGSTLEIRMWPLIKATRRMRAYMGSGIARALWMSARILQQKNFSDIPARAVKSIIERRVIPSFAPVLPRDHQATVDEVVKLLSTTPPAISLETSQKILGRGPGEVERIKAMLQDEELMKALKEFQQSSSDVQEAQAGKLTPQTTKKAE